jgi:hypothetical protein
VVVNKFPRVPAVTSPLAKVAANTLGVSKNPLLIEKYVAIA